MEQLDLPFPPPPPPLPPPPAPKWTDWGQQLRLWPLHWGIRLKRGYRPACKRKEEFSGEPTTRAGSIVSCKACLKYMETNVCWGDYADRAARRPPPEWPPPHLRARIIAADDEPREVPGVALDGGRLFWANGREVESERQATFKGVTQRRRRRRR